MTKSQQASERQFGQGDGRYRCCSATRVDESGTTSGEYVK